MPVDEDLLLLLKSATLGEGEPDLGEKLLQAFLTQLLKVGRLPQRIICMNTGVFLTTKGSPVLEQMRCFEEAGSRIQSCGTCLEYYGRKESLEVGQAGNMRDTVEAMLSYRRVLQP